MNSNALTDLRTLQASLVRCVLSGVRRGNIWFANISSQSFEESVFSYTPVHCLMTAISAWVNSRGGSGGFLGLGAVPLASGGGGAVGVDMVGGKEKEKLEAQ